MPRFFFHAEDGRCIPDEEGTELKDLAAARVEATRVLGGILQTRPQELLETGSLRLITTDARRLTLFVIETATLNAPAGGWQDPARPA